MITVLITLTTAGTDTGPFNLYSDVDGYVTPFETGVTKAALQGGYISIIVPDGTTTIRVQSTSVDCTNFVDMPITGTTTTTTTPTPPAIVNLTVDFPDYLDTSVTDLKVNTIPITVTVGTIPTVGTTNVLGETYETGLCDVVVAITGSTPNVTINVITPTDGSSIQSGPPGTYTFFGRTINAGDNIFIAAEQ